LQNFGNVICNITFVKIGHEPPVVSHWRRLPRRIGNCSGNTKITSTQQFYTT